MTNQRIKVRGILWNNLQFASLIYNRASSRWSEWENPQMRHAIIVKCLFFLLEISKLIFYYIFIAQTLLLSISQLKVTSIVFFIERYYTIFSLFSISYFPPSSFTLLFFFIVSSLPPLPFHIIYLFDFFNTIVSHNNSR